MGMTELRERGRAMRERLYGPEAVARLDADLYTDDPIMEKFAELTQEVTFGIFWSREGLDLKSRALVTVACDVATGQVEALGLHLRFARRQGWSEDELVEAILHLATYVGVAPVRRALIVARDAFADMRSEVARGGTDLPQ